MFLGESGHFHFWVNVTTFTFAFFHFCFLSFGPFVILNCSSCQKNATDEGAIALKALDFQINVKNCISYFNIGGQKKKSVEYKLEKVPGIPAPRIHLFPSPASQHPNYSLLSLDLVPQKQELKIMNVKLGKFKFHPFCPSP